MKVLIDIPEAFEVDYNSDRFADFFQRCLADMGTCCGNFELEIAVMMIRAFAESRPYDPDKVVEQLEYQKNIWNHDEVADTRLVDEKGKAYTMAIKIVKGGGVNDNTD